MSDFRFYNYPGTSTTRVSDSKNTYGNSNLVQKVKAEQEASQKATAVATMGPYGQSAAMGTQTGGGVVSMPNLNWYYSSADAYGINGQDPRNPMSGALQEVTATGERIYTPMWNWGVDSKAAGEDLFDDPAFVSPYQKAIMRAFAKSVHPSGTESGVWEDAVAASMSMSQRGIFKSPMSIVSQWLTEWQASGGGPGGSSSGGGGSWGGGFGGGGGGGGPQVNLMNENDARAVVNTLASQMLGRTVSEKEFRGYYDSILQLQKDNPTTVEFTEDGSQVVQQGIGADGLRYNMEEQMRNTEDFVTNSIGTQALDLLEAYIAKRSL